MGSKAPQTQTVKNETVADPTTRAWQQALFSNATNLYNQGPAQYYPGQTVAPYTNQTLQGLGMMQQQAQQGAWGMPQAQQALSGIMGGFMPGMGTAMQASMGGMMNPWGGAIQNAANQTVAPQIAGQIATGSAANPYTQQIAAAGQQGAAGAVQPMVNQAMTSASNAGGANPYGAQLANAGAQQTTAGVNSLNSFANQDLSHLDGLYQQGREQITNDLNARFAQAGRTGANAAYGKAYGGALGDLYTNIYAPGMEAARDRQLNAAGQLAGISQNDRAAHMAGLEGAGQFAEAGFGRQMQGASMGLDAANLYGSVLGQDANRNLQGATSAGSLAEGMYGRNLDAANLYGGYLSGDIGRQYQGATDLANLSESGFDRQLQGAQLSGNMWGQRNADQMNAIGMLPGLYQYGGMPAEQMLGVGGAYEQMNQAMIDADIDRWNFGQNAGWENLGRMSQVMSGMPDFSSTSQTSTGPKGSRGMSLLGGAATGASIGSAIPGIGTAIGAGLGGLFGLFG